MRFSLVLILMSLGLTASTAGAHPILNRFYERTIVVRLSADAVTVDYQLDVDENTAIIDLMVALGDRDELSKLNGDTIYSAYTRSYGPILADNLVGALDGKPLAFKCIQDRHQRTDHLRCSYRFQAKWEPGREGSHKFMFRDGTYETEAGLVRLSLAHSETDYPPLVGNLAGLLSGSARMLVAVSTIYPGRIDASVKIESKQQPSEALQAKSALDRTGAEDDQLRELSATFSVRGKAAPLPDLYMPAEDATSDRAPSELRDLLLDTRMGFWVMMYLAAFFGAAHALTPGHGKTLVAAYLVGEHGTVWHAILLGLVTTLTHTGAVIILAAILPLVLKHSDIEFGLQLGGGVVVAGLGIWLFFRRVSGQADHIHLGSQGHNHHHGHADHHHHGHSHDQLFSHTGAKVSLASLIVLGMTGGIVPCWDAILMFALALGAGRLWLGLPLLLAFSAGLASVLIVIGIFVVKAKGFAGSHWGESRVFRALPVMSALLVTAMGLWLCYRSVH